MNILYLHAHDAGRYLQPYGAPVATPSLQAFAGQSVVFRNAHSAAPTCSPSRAALLTGRSPHAAGMLGLAHRGFSLHQPEQHLAAFLGSHGWHTALCGIQHLHYGEHSPLPYKETLSADKSQGWAAYDSGVAKNAADFLAERPVSGNDDPPAPFFLDCGFWYPHRPFPEIDSASLEPNFVRPPFGSSDTPEVRVDTAAFHAAVQHMDDCVGKVLKALEKSAHRDNTLVLFTVDHGIAFPAHKCQLTDRGTGVALMVRPPISTGDSRGGAIRDQLISHLDVFPTLCELAGLDTPSWLEGGSFAGLLKGDADRNSPPPPPQSIRNEVFSEVTYHAAYEPQRSIRTLDYRLIRRFDEDPSPVPANVDASPSKQSLLAAGWQNRMREKTVLYDLRLDPDETENRAQDPALASVRTDLENRLGQWMRDTSDPLLEGSLAPPRGAQVDPRGQIEPS